MKLIPLLFCIAISVYGRANESYRMAHYSLVYDSLDQSIPEDSAVFYFDLKSLNPYLRDSRLIYAVDNGENQFYDYKDGDTLRITTTPGTHSFQFYAGSNYEESPVISLEIEAQHRQMYQLFFQQTNIQMHVRKPVMYFYPEQTIDLKVDVNPVGEFTFTYPPIEKGWNFSCTPDGLLNDGKTNYRYLFWESQQPGKESLIDRTKGAVVSGNEVVAYLDETMQKFGMNSTERADLITYWGPILQTKSNLYIYLLFNDVCDAFASLEISPKPDQIARFYVLWSEVPEDYTPSLEPQEVPVMNREGFTVLEWGGAEFDNRMLLNSNL